MQLLRPGKKISLRSVSSAGFFFEEGSGGDGAR